MSEDVKEKKCIFCGKKMLDEKLSFCLRCRLEGRNTTAKVVEVIATVAATAQGIKTIKDNSDSGGRMK